jgi:hypothetical protein
VPLGLRLRACPVAAMTKKRKRLKQVEAWLRLNFPPPCKVTVRVENFSDSVVGDIGEGYGGQFIRVSSLGTMHEQIETLMHEYAHLLADDGDRHHGPNWGSAYQKIVELWQDEGGEEDSRDL